MKKINVGILGAAGYTGGELIRLLINHPEVNIVFANSESNAGNKVYDVHEGLLGETDLEFTSEMPFDKVDVVFFCFGHGKSEAFLKEHDIPAGVKIIDMAQDFRIAAPTHDYVYGLPEIHRAQIAACQHLANPGCFATCIQLGLLPAAKAGLLIHDISVNAITGSTGAGQKPAATTHFSWRSDNFSVYKLFTHQHLHEICQSLNELRPASAPHVVDTLDEGFNAEGITVDFIPYRGDFARGIFCTEVITLDQPAVESDIVALYKSFYEGAAFT
ncbi:MAG: N-acetyl-gamma-glutamyl-phosphate reductase, partial [Bacteroidaceae bacterium]|nr:N-acetyl-gamma-glutamyl-phosphate reductase [Bacteroidaceae bacterium]